SSLFSGGGLADIGMIAAGWRPVWGVEHSPDIASVYRANIHACILVADVRTVDFAGLKRPDHLHASPPCTRASVANSDATESPLDGELAEAVCRAIRGLRPDTFTLENVYGYRKFKAYHAILQTLYDCGYEFEQHHCNAALYGVPQTRMRLILRASRIGRMKPLQPTHSPSPQAQGLFDDHAPLLPWIGWYAAIEDLIPTLPESKFADWQLARLPYELTECAYFDRQQLNAREATRSVASEPATSIVATVARRPSTSPVAYLVESRNANQQFGDGLCASHEPATSVCASSYGVRGGKAFLVSDQSGAAGNGLQITQPGEPATTIRANSGGGAAPRAFIVEGTAAGTDNTFALPVREQDDPIFTVHGSNPLRAFLVGGKPANFEGDLSVSGSASPTPTLTASHEKHPFRAYLAPVNGEHSEGRGQAPPAPTVTANHAAEKSRAWLDQGRVVSMTPRALARFQSVPDWYQLPANKKLATVVLGNGVPSLIMQRIAESLQ
ncbi:MAG TPA: DNA cytosine methyltransferase, partial [Bryobacteraceae bacterium]|nr:DNA cytosine methyltransferase [Bryobacteraceae bacterium]